MTPVEIMEKYKVWAVVGATTNPDKYGYKIYKKLKEKGYTVYPISPNHDEIEGETVYKTLFDLPVKPDVVNFVVNPRIGVGIVKACSDLGIKNIWLQPGTINNELLALAQENEIEATQACVLVVANYL